LSGGLSEPVWMELLAAGHQVRTSVGSLKREGDVRAMLKEGGADPGDRLSVIAANLVCQTSRAESLRAPSIQPPPNTNSSW
jgi:dihydroflavonol-4-reductase